MEQYFAVDKGVTHIEFMSLDFDRWTLTVSLRVYEQDPDDRSDNRIKGIVTISFRGTWGIRYLDRCDMLRYPFPDTSSDYYVHRILKAGWLDQEKEHSNFEKEGQEYLIPTSGECICVFYEGEPQMVKDF